MTLQELRKAVDEMLRHPPKPESIATIKTAREFKDLAKKARTVSSFERLQSAYNQLRSYYG